MNEKTRSCVAGHRRPRPLFALVLSGSWLLSLPAAAITIATYNVENYLVADRMVDGVYRQAYPKPEKAKAALRRVIGGIDPDILAVQEMGGREFLGDFQRELRHAGQDFPHVALLDAVDPDRHVAVLSKLPFRDVRRHARIPVTHQGRSDAVRRGVLEAVFASDAGDFSLFVVHLKSRHTERPDDPESALRRAGEAEAVRDLVLSRHPDPAQALFLVCGDINDTRNSRPVRALRKRGDTVIGEILQAVDSRGEVWTHYYRPTDTYSRVDYLIASPALLPRVADGGAVIWDGPGTAEASDHRPVYVKLMLERFK